MSEDDSAKKALKQVCDAYRPVLDACTSEGVAAANQILINAGFRPEKGAMAPISLFLGYWMGRNLSLGVPIEEAIAEIDEVAGTSIETLERELEEDLGAGRYSVDEVIHARMLKTCISALELLCDPGRAVEVATVLVRMTGEALVDHVSEHPLPS